MPDYVHGYSASLQQTIQVALGTVRELPTSPFEQSLKVLKVLETLGYNVSPGCCEPDAMKQAEQSAKQANESVTFSGAGRFINLEVVPSPLKVGDVVMLKSGGPKMVLRFIGERDGLPMEQTAICDWYEETTKDYRDVKLYLVSLGRVDDNPKEVAPRIKRGTRCYGVYLPKRRAEIPAYTYIYDEKYKAEDTAACNSGSEVKEIIIQEIDTHGDGTVQDK